MKYAAAIFLFIVFSLPALARDCPAVPTRIAEAIHSHIAALRATEYCDARTVKTVNGVTVAIYTAEGACAGQDSRAEPGTCSTHWVRYMVALSGKRVSPPIEVGGKGGFTDTGVTISGAKIEIKGRSIGPGDPLCCPSVPETKKYKISRSGLSEVRW